MTNRTTTSPTAVVLMNLGGPAGLDDIGPFLERLFDDREIIQLPMQKWLGRFIARRRTPAVKERYRLIGGGSPILGWTEAQGRGLCERLDELSPETAPHRHYIAFRYSAPFSDDALQRMQRDGVRRAIAFTMYPQFSCATTGSSLNELWRSARRLGLGKAFDWSVIDRWHAHPGFVDAMAATVREGLDRFPPDERDDVVLLFSAHSLPMKVIRRGDPYPQEIGATVHEVMRRIGGSHEYLLSYQSEVGPLTWLGPSTEKVLHQLAAKKRRHVLVIPIAFTSDHIETLSELDLEYGDMARRAGITHYHRAPALNARPDFLDAIADVVFQHIRAQEPCSRQYGLRCPGCVNPHCRQVPNAIGEFPRTAVTVTSETHRLARLA